MPTRIDFRNCVHQGVAGPTPDHILATIRAEYCLPRAALPAPRRGGPPRTAPVQLEDFPALARALGAEAFRQLTSDVLRDRDPGATLARLPEFLRRHRYGRATPALADLAQLDLAVARSTLAPADQSIGACCLPPDLLRAHPDLTFAFHPAWRWLELSHPVDRWRVALLAGAEASEAPAPRPVRLRIQPQHGAIAVRRLTADEFAFEQALQQGQPLRQAETQTLRGSAGGAPKLDPIRQLQTLLMAGAVIGATLHPRPDALQRDTASANTHRTNQSKEVTS